MKCRGPKHDRHRITPFLWFDTQAEEAAMFLNVDLPNSKIGRIVRNHRIGARAHRRVLTVESRWAGTTSSR
jgi:predicted 3-demethylubiquinone-9 3-methyltransferase (glyoxalase superfamily)